MNKMCEFCGRTQSDAIADAKTLGLEQEFEAGIYTCCQVSAWADEQAVAWLEAIDADEQGADEQIMAPQQGESQAVFVFVRASRPQVPWYKNPNCA
jgi:hypothetical protein